MIWWLLIPLGVVAIIFTFVNASVGAGIAVVVGVLAVWIGWGVVWAHYSGLRRHIVQHLGTRDLKKGQVLTHVIPTSERVNLQLALDHLHQTGSPRRSVFGIPNDGFGKPPSVIGLIGDNPEPEPVQSESFPRSKDEMLDCATNALYLLTHQGQPYCALLRPRAERSRTQMELEITARNRETALRALEHVLATAHARSVYRGAILALEKSEDRREEFALKFHALAPVPRDSIILPEDVMRVVERNVRDFLSHAETLRRAGRSTRHGLLFHGPPGVGKTLVTKYLAQSCPGCTVILLTGRHMGFIRESCQLARLLAPSIVVLEDVDLIATDRRRNRDNRLLYELMNEMDGLGNNADCVFLLTTNRPEVLETALAARPGRVDQAIYFPLPDLDCRRRLFRHFGHGLDLAAVDVEPLLRRTEGASPAFIQELFRKAALFAAERGERSQPLKLTGEDFEQALRELVEFGGELTRNLLGFRAREGAATADATARPLKGSS